MCKTWYIYICRRNNDKKDPCSPKTYRVFSAHLPKLIESSVVFLYVMFFQVCDRVLVLQTFERSLWRLKVLSEKKYIFSMNKL